MGSDETPKCGLFLQGGGALGAWQAAALDVLVEAGWRFDVIMGFSIGAVNGTALALGRRHQWRGLRRAQALRFQPKLRPFSLCAPVDFDEFLPVIRDDAAAKAALKTELVIVSASRAQDAPLNARFTPGGQDGWDAPLLGHLSASCAIPWIYPPVELDVHDRRLTLIDGGTPMSRPLDMSPLFSCGEILVLEMVRLEEIGRRFWTPWRVHDQIARETCRKLVDDGVARLLDRAEPPRIRRLAPSRVLAPIMLDFRASSLAPLLELGGRDARAFLAA